MTKSERLSVSAHGVASVGRSVASREYACARGMYRVECVGSDGVVKWRDTVPNLVTTQGGNDMLDKYLAGSSYTAAFFLGLIAATSYTAVALGDTAASHAGWLEAGSATAPAYSQSTRPAPSWSAASAKVKATSVAVVYTITSSGTIKGVFLSTSATKDGTSGVLFSAGLFSGGDKVVAATDSVNVSYQLTV